MFLVNLIPSEPEPDTTLVMSQQSSAAPGSKVRDLNRHAVWAAGTGVT